MAAKIAHVSLFKRYHNANYSPGGVERFGFFLKQAIPELEVYSIQDLPPEVNIALHTSQWEVAEYLNSWLLKEKLVDENTIVLADGWWVNGLQGKVARLISVVHGTYTSTAIEHEKSPFDEPHTLEFGVEQDKIWNDDRVEVVAVSKRTAFELQHQSNIKPDAIIEHGIPLDIYKPDRKPKNRLILHVATSLRKGKDTVAEINAMNEFKIEQLGFAPNGDMEEEARLWNRGGIFFAPTRFEGNSYALLEAIACGLVPVSYATGFAYDIPCDVGLVTDDYHTKNFVTLLKEASEFYSQFMPAEWAKEHIGFDRFAKRWRAYLDD